MTTSKARQYYVSAKDHRAIKEIGRGNYSRGIRIAASYHGRLVEALRECVHWCPRELTHDARALLAALEAEKGGES